MRSPFDRKLWRTERQNWSQSCRCRPNAVATRKSSCRESTCRAFASEMAFTLRLPFTRTTYARQWSCAKTPRFWARDACRNGPFLRICTQSAVTWRSKSTTGHFSPEFPNKNAIVKTNASFRVLKKSLEYFRTEQPKFYRMELNHLLKTWPVNTKLNRKYWPNVEHWFIIC